MTCSVYPPFFFTEIKSSSSQTCRHINFIAALVFTAASPAPSLLHPITFQNCHFHYCIAFEPSSWVGFYILTITNILPSSPHQWSSGSGIATCSRRSSNVAASRKMTNWHNHVCKNRCIGRKCAICTCSSTPILFLVLFFKLRVVAEKMPFSLYLFYVPAEPLQS